MLRFVTTADTEILATAEAVSRLPAGFPNILCANPNSGPDHSALVDDVVDGARVVLCRILGGIRGWPGGFELLRARCIERGIVLLALGGEAEPDAEMTAASTAPAGAVAQAGEYLRHGDVDNIAQLFRFLADTFLYEGFGFEAPHEVPDVGIYLPGEGDVPMARAVARHEADRPTVGICFYRSHRLTGNVAFVDALCDALLSAGANVIAVWSYSLRPSPTGCLSAFDLLSGRVDALITTMLATGGSGAKDTKHGPGDGVGAQWQEWDAAAPTIGRLAAAMKIPEGGKVRYVLAKWALAGSGGLLEPGLFGSTGHFRRASPRESHEVGPRRQRSGVTDCCQGLNSINEAGAGTDKNCIGVNRPDRHAGRDDVTLNKSAGKLLCADQVIATWRNDHEICPTPGQSSGRHSYGALSRSSERGYTAGRADHVGYPVASREKRFGPLHHSNAWTGPPGHRGGHPRPPGPQVNDELSCLWLPAGCRPDRDDRTEDLVESPGVDRQDLTVAAEMAERFVDGADVDGADRTQVLCDDKIGLEVVESTLVQMVKIFTVCDPGPDFGIDLGRSEARRQR
jgi:hypothetical protein